VKLPERVINLKSSPAQPTYLKVTVTLEFADPEHKYIKLKGEALAVANEHFTKELVGSKTIDQVSTTEGRDRLKLELTDAINHQLHDHEVESVFFEVFITQ
jgi:flagellar basal body-associated protein FliL